MLVFFPHTIFSVCPISMAFIRGRFIFAMIVCNPGHFVACIIVNLELKTGAYGNIITLRTYILKIKATILQFDIKYLRPNFQFHPYKWNSLRPVSDTLRFVYHLSGGRRTFRKDYFCTNRFERQQRRPYCSGKSFCILGLEQNKQINCNIFSQINMLS